MVNNEVEVTSLGGTYFFNKLLTRVMRKSTKNNQKLHCIAFLEYPHMI